MTILYNYQDAKSYVIRISIINIEKLIIINLKCNFLK